MSVPDQCGLFNRDCAFRKTPVIHGEEFLRVCKLGDGGPIRIQSITRKGNAGWIVEYYGPEISFPQSTDNH